MYICINWSNFQIKFHSYENASAYIPNKLEQFSLKSNPLPDPIHKNKKNLGDSYLSLYKVYVCEWGVVDSYPAEVVKFLPSKNFINIFACQILTLLNILKS